MSEPREFGFVDFKDNGATVIRPLYECPHCYAIVVGSRIAAHMKQHAPTSDSEPTPIDGTEDE